MAVASDGKIALGDGASYEISVFRLSREADPPAWVLDEPHRIVRRTVDPEAVTDADIQHLRDAYTRSSNAPDYLAEGVQKAFDEYDFPDRWPAFVRLMFDAEGHLWAERPGRDAQDPRATANWDVFAPDGTYLGEVSLPGSTRVLAISSDRVIAVLTDELDVPYLKGYRINR